MAVRDGADESMPRHAMHMPRYRLARYVRRLAGKALAMPYLAMKYCALVMPCHSMPCNAMPCHVVCIAGDEMPCRRTPCHMDAVPCRAIGLLPAHATSSPHCSFPCRPCRCSSCHGLAASSPLPRPHTQLTMFTACSCWAAGVHVGHAVVRHAAHADRVLRGAGVDHGLHTVRIACMTMWQWQLLWAVLCGCCSVQPKRTHA